EHSDRVVRIAGEQQRTAEAIERVGVREAAGRRRLQGPMQRRDRLRLGAAVAVVLAAGGGGALVALCECVTCLCAWVRWCLCERAGGVRAALFDAWPALVEFELE